MVHAVRDYVGEGAAVGLLFRQVVQHVEPAVVPAVAARTAMGDAGKVRGGAVQPFGQTPDRSASRGGRGGKVVAPAINVTCLAIFGPAEA